MSVEVMSGGGSANLQSKVVTPAFVPCSIKPDNGYDGFSSLSVGKDANLIPENIVSGKTIYGVTGTAIDLKKVRATFTGVSMGYAEFDVAFPSDVSGLFAARIFASGMELYWGGATTLFAGDSSETVGARYAHDSTNDFAEGTVDFNVSTGKIMLRNFSGKNTGYGILFEQGVTYTADFYFMKS